MTNLGKEPLSIKKGSAFAQGVFVEYGITLDDEPVTDLRKGGFGSTDKKV
jgi:dUTP pyrophosphatase